MTEDRTIMRFAKFKKTVSEEIAQTRFVKAISIKNCQNLQESTWKEVLAQ